MNPELHIRFFLTISSAIVDAKRRMRLRLLEITVNHFGAAIGGHGVEHQAYRLVWCAATGSGHTGDAYTQRRFAAIADALRQGQRPLRG